MGKISNGTLLNLVKWGAVIIFSAGSVYAVVHYRLNTAEGNIKAVEVDIESIKTDDIPKAIEPIKSDIKRIKEVDLPNIEGDLDYHDDRLYEQEKEVFGVKKELGYLKESVDRNYKVQEQILTEIKELHK